MLISGSGGQPRGARERVQAGCGRDSGTSGLRFRLAPLRWRCCCRDAASFPVSMNPVSWWHDLQGGKIAEERPPPPGADQPYPNLATVPPKPAAPDRAALANIASALVADRTNAQHAAAAAPMADPSSPSASPALFGRGTVPPPPPPPPPGTATASATMPAAEAPPRRRRRRASRPDRTRAASGAGRPARGAAVGAGAERAARAARRRRRSRPPPRRRHRAAHCPPRPAAAADLPPACAAAPPPPRAGLPPAAPAPPPPAAPATCRGDPGTAAAQRGQLRQRDVRRTAPPRCRQPRPTTLKQLAAGGAAA